MSEAELIRHERGEKMKSLLEMETDELKKLVKEFLIERFIDTDEGDCDTPGTFYDYVFFIVDEKTLIIKIFKKIMEYDPNEEDLVWKKPAGIIITVRAVLEGDKLKVVDVS